MACRLADADAHGRTRICARIPPHELARCLPWSSTMFQITVVDHVRLSFASILAAYEGHADAAAKLARWNSYAQAV